MRYILYIRVTINKRSVSYVCLKKRPGSMLPNQFLVIVPIEVNTVEWFNRFVETGIIQPHPPEAPKISQIVTEVDKNTAGKVMDRMLGRSP